MLQNAYLPATIAFDTAEHEPSKIWQKTAKKSYSCSIRGATSNVGGALRFLEARVLTSRRAAGRSC